MADVPAPTDLDSKEVYAFFGLAVYSCQCLEQAVMHLIALFELYPAAGHTRQDYDDLRDTLNRKTLGRLLRQLSEHHTISEHLEGRLKDALDRRNFLCHRFFAHYAEHFFTRDGRAEMIRYLRESAELFGSLDEELEPITQSMLERLGVTEDTLERMYRELLAKAQRGEYEPG